MKNMHLQGNLRGMVLIHFPHQEKVCKVMNTPLVKLLVCLILSYLSKIYNHFDLAQTVQEVVQLGLQQLQYGKKLTLVAVEEVLHLLRHLE